MPSRPSWGARYTGVSDFSETEKEVYDALWRRQAIDFDAAQAMVLLYLEKWSPAEGESLAERITGSPSKRAVLLELHQRMSKDKKLRAAMQEADGAKKVAKGLVVEKTFEPAIQQMQAERELAKHGFVRPGLMTLLREARKTGVVPTFAFRSLKARDRTLWYCLHCVGRRVAFVEAAGAFAHWQMESVVGVRIDVPEVTAAVHSLQEAIGEGHPERDDARRRKEKMGDSHDREPAETNRNPTPFSGNGKGRGAGKRGKQG